MENGRIEELRKLSSDLEDGNYRTESAFLRAVARMLEAKPDAQVDDLVGFIVDYDWEG